jgi:hypothetical protein
MKKYVDALDALLNHEATAPFVKNVKTRITPDFLYYEWDAFVPCFIVEHHGKYYDVQDTLDPRTDISGNPLDFSKMNSYNTPLQVADAIIDRWSEM